MAKSKPILTRDELRALANKQLAAELAGNIVATKYVARQLEALEAATLPTPAQRKEASQAQMDRWVVGREQDARDRRDWQAIHAKVKNIQLPDE
jgi:hypothetical protein